MKGQDEEKSGAQEENRNSSKPCIFPVSCLTSTALAVPIPDFLLIFIPHYSAYVLPCI